MCSRLSFLARAALAVAGSLALAACGGSFGGTGLTTSGIPNIPNQTAFRLVGTIGTPFTGVISDGRSSWSFKGTVPLTIMVIKGAPPYRIMVTKSASDTTLLSVQIIDGYTLAAVSSTSQPFGSVQLQTGGTLAAMAPRAAPDVRFFYRGPKSALMTGIIEDLDSSIAVEQRAPSLFLFDSPHGRVDGIFNELNPYNGEPGAQSGPIAVDLIYTQPPNGTQVCRVISNSGKITMRYPGCAATPLSALTNETGLPGMDSPY